jgi:hypothetical protein
VVTTSCPLSICVVHRVATLEILYAGDQSIHLCFDHLDTLLERLWRVRAMLYWEMQ